MVLLKLTIVFTIYFVPKVSAVNWKKIKCATDTDQNVSPGLVSDISRFPWLGIVQHTFHIGGRTKFAITGAVLVHPGYAIAPAEDIAKIRPEALGNNTKLIVWRSEKDKFALDINDYILHPDYMNMVTFATVALLELENWEYGKQIAPVAPVCLPIHGSGTFDNLYAVQMTDKNNEIGKEVFEVDFVPNKDCQEFYSRSKLTYKMMAPVSQLCAVVRGQSDPCVWDAGTVLITRQNWGYWVLLGFGARGPGCGSPARYISIHPFLTWISDIITRKPIEENAELKSFMLRQMSPYKLIMYQADVKIPIDHGQCERGKRGAVLFKDSSEILMTKNFGQGFYYTEVWQIAEFNCAKIMMETNSRTNAAVWLEHHCHRELTGLSPGMRLPDLAKTECFVYFKSVAFMEFRFFFSFKASIELTLYGKETHPRYVPNPWQSTETTYGWWPTDRIIKWNLFFPYYLWYYGL